MTLLGQSLCVDTKYPNRTKMQGKYLDSSLLGTPAGSGFTGGAAVASGWVAVLGPPLTGGWGAVLGRRLTV